MAELKRYNLEIPKEKWEYALRYGAQLDETTSTFYVLGDIPEPLEEFSTERIERTPLPRRPAPSCPGCMAPMVKHTTSKGTFWGCSNFPRCRKTRRYTEKQGDFDSTLFPAISSAKDQRPTSDRATYADYARVAQKALEILGEEHFDNWLFGPNAEIGSLAPADLLGTRRGVLHVTGLLNKLEENNPKSDSEPSENK